MSRIAYIVAILIILGANGLRAFLKSGQSRPLSFWIITIYLQVLPFGFALDVSARVESPGSWGGVMVINPAHILGVLLLFLAALRGQNPFKLSQAEWKYLLAISGLFFISYTNPANQYPFGSAIAFFFFLAPLVFWSGARKNISKDELFRAVYDGLVVAISIQFILSICYPILGLEFVLGLFRDASLEWATRLGTRGPSAVGTFPHPGNLALFTTMCGTFFLSSYLNKCEIKKSAIFCVISFGIVWLTQSRTSILAITSAYVLTFAAHNILIQKKGVLNLVLIAFVGILFTTGLLLSPLGDIFLRSDLLEMSNARLIHYQMGWTMFLENPLRGVGVNTHIAYEARNFSMIQTAVAEEMDDFFTSNPIHNIHIIILCEMGLIGISIWLASVISAFRSSVGILKSPQYPARAKIFNLAFLAGLYTVVVYGMTGWAPTTAEQVGLLTSLMFSSIILSNNPFSPMELTQAP